MGELVQKRPQDSRKEVALDLWDHGLEVVGARPIGVVGFVASATALLMLMGASAGSFRSDAVAVADRVEHPAMVASFVTELFVAPGELVEVGMPLARLSPHFLDQRIARIDSQIEEVRNEAKLAQAEIAIVEQRWVATSTRVRPGRPSLRNPTEAVFARQVEVLETRRAALLENRDTLLIRSRAPGLVALVAPLGGAVEEGGSVASVSPVHADEVIAYVSPETAPHAIEPGAPARIEPAGGQGCLHDATVLRRGAGVVPAPEQLQGFLPVNRHGLPVHISVPDDCQLGVGQVVTVDFPQARAGR